MAARIGDYLLVVGLDFGTTFSGYAFSFRDDPEKIICNTSWGEELGFQSYKTPTSVLTNGAGEFITMGYRAEQKYSEDMEEKGSAADLHLYRHFKMLLQKSKLKDVSLKAVVTSEDGTIRPAVDIFGYAIGFLRKQLMDAIKAKTVTVPDPSSILWVITVPAIWSEPSKKFMREAAKRGGCVNTVDAKNLILALEPEAASLCCRRPNVAGYRSEQGIAFPPDTTYLVLDCGGGTVDITAHRTLEGDKIEEILPASGGPWGGMYVDTEFTRLLGELLGTDFINRYKLTHPHGWLELISSFETTKKPFNEKDQKSLRVSLPWSFGDFYSETKEGKNIKSAIQEFQNSGVSFNSGSLIVKNDIAKGFFAPVVGEIISHVRGLLMNPKMDGCQYIFMVGGFSESRLLQDEVKKNFETNITKVLVPSEAQLAVLKGAVLFGQFPTEITTRIARKTYGHAASVRFDPNIHSQSKKFKDYEGNLRCTNVFYTLVKQGEPISIGTERKRTIWPKSKTETHTYLTIYCKNGQPDHPVQYTDAPDVEVMGKAVTTHPPCGHRDANKITVIFIFGSTEIKIRSIHEATGKEFTASVDFCSDPSIY